MFEGFELDHFFVCSERNTAIVPYLENLGLTFGASRMHPGQGTTNTCFFFDNAYFEILWPHNEQELLSEKVRKTRLWDRLNWKKTHACPFGIAIRPTGNVDWRSHFSTWDYDAPFLPPGACIPVATEPDLLTEPLIFLIPGSVPPAGEPPELRPPLEHLGKRRKITCLDLVLPVEECSSALKKLVEWGIVRYQQGANYFLKVGWDFEIDTQELDFRPLLPMSFAW
ncbi:MAG TPA: VOC family protein [Acidobacteriota bacterium]|nr:VOC family protein [Acidobacteriota bacterium]HMZ78903.1 VOC family protein [Acidobacteriota bacterium]HND20728.1 VOC family protein [Acidobacteriota bacterium]HNG93995.1 VOC family protein [Acidobacteriota bacterium]HNH82937.1 VOC family protein [Acidobacteriota bacterium]